jgi:hypothetical protein
MSYRKNIYLYISILLGTYSYFENIIRGIFMERYLTSHQVVKILKEHGITDSLQMVVRWIRENKLPGIRTENRKVGYLVLEDDLYEFITEKNPGIVQMKLCYQDQVDKQVLPKDLFKDKIPAKMVVPSGASIKTGEKLDNMVKLEEQTEEKMEKAPDEKYSNEFSLLEEKINQQEEKMSHLISQVGNLESKLNERLTNELSAQKKTFEERFNALNEKLDEGFGFNSLKQSTNETSINKSDGQSSDGAVKNNKSSIKKEHSC